MASGDLITTGVVWRGIGPAVPPAGRGRPYRQVGPQVTFTPEAFTERMEKHQDDPALRTFAPSVVDPTRAADAQQACDLLRRMGMDIRALAGLQVEDICATKLVPSTGGPVKGVATPTAPTLMLEVVHDPCTVEDVVFEAHTLIRPQPTWHPRKQLDAMSEILATLATQFHHDNGWALPPAA